MPWTQRARRIRVGRPKIGTPKGGDVPAPRPPDSGAGYGDLGVLLGVGDTLAVGFYIDTSDDDLNTGLNKSGSSSVGIDELLMENLVIWADADAAADDNYQFEAA